MEKLKVARGVWIMLVTIMHAVENGKAQLPDELFCAHVNADDAIKFWGR